MLNERPYFQSPATDSNSRRFSSGKFPRVWIVLLAIAGFCALIEALAPSSLETQLCLIWHNGLATWQLWRPLSCLFVSGLRLPWLILTLIMLCLLCRELERQMSSRDLHMGLLRAALAALACALPLCRLWPTQPFALLPALTYGMLALFALHHWHERLHLQLFFVIPVALSGKALFFALGVLIMTPPLLSHSLADLRSALPGLVAALALASHRFHWIHLPPWPWMRRRRPTAAAFTYIPPRTAAPATAIDPDAYIRHQVDPILDKIAKHGSASLTAEDRAILAKAQEILLKDQSP